MNCCNSSNSIFWRFYLLLRVKTVEFMCSFTMLWWCSYILLNWHWKNPRKSRKIGAWKTEDEDPKTFLKRLSYRFKIRDWNCRIQEVSCSCTCVLEAQQNFWPYLFEFSVTQKNHWLNEDFEKSRQNSNSKITGHSLPALLHVRIF